MIEIKNPASLKGKIRNIAKQKKIPAQVILQNFDHALFIEALRATSAHRGTAEQIADVKGILTTISESAELKALWKKYQKQFSYAEKVEYEDIMRTVSVLLEKC